MALPFSIWLFSALAQLAVSHPIGSHEHVYPTQGADPFDKFDAQTAEAFRKYMLNPEDTRKRLAAMIPNIEQNEEQLNILRRV